MGPTWWPHEPCYQGHLLCDVGAGLGTYITFRYFQRLQFLYLQFTQKTTTWIVHSIYIHSDAVCDGSRLCRLSAVITRRTMANFRGTRPCNADVNLVGLIHMQIILWHFRQNNTNLYLGVCRENLWKQFLWSNAFNKLSHEYVNDADDDIDNTHNCMCNIAMKLPYIGFTLLPRILSVFQVLWLVVLAVFCTMG